MSQTDRWRIEDCHLPVLHGIERIMQGFPHRVQKRSYGRKRIFPNGMRCDLLCHQVSKPAVLRISRGARIAKEYPTLSLLFDETKSVISKIYLKDTTQLETKAIADLVALLTQLPAGIGYDGTKRK